MNKQRLCHGSSGIKLDGQGKATQKEADLSLEIAPRAARALVSLSLSTFRLFIFLLRPQEKCGASQDMPALGPEVAERTTMECGKTMGRTILPSRSAGSRSIRLANFIILFRVP